MVELEEVMVRLMVQILVCTLMEIINKLQKESINSYCDVNI